MAVLSIGTQLVSGVGSESQHKGPLCSGEGARLVFQSLYLRGSCGPSTLPPACTWPCWRDEVFQQAQRQVGMGVCAKQSAFEFHRRLSPARLGPWTIKFTKAHSELISKYILIHADLFSSWGLFITHCRFNIGLPSVITKDSMVGHNYIMQMTFAVLFELIPSDVSFLYHTPHTSVSPRWLCTLPLSLVPKFLVLSVPTVTQTRPAVGMPRVRRVPLTQVMLTAGRNRCTLILPSNGNTHLAPSQRTGMKNLFSSHFFGDWLTVLWHSTLWLFVSSLVLRRLRRVPEKSQRRPACGTMNYSSTSPGWWQEEDRAVPPLPLAPRPVRHIATHLRS